MKIVVIGGTGRVGSKVVADLSGQGHEALAASPRRGVNSITGEGLAEALDGAAVVVDVSNSPSFDYAPALEFFETSTRNLLKAEEAAGVGHHVALSIVGIGRLPEVGYYRAKVAQEELIEASSIPHSIVHATQLFEFTKGVVDDAADGNTVRLVPALFQPVAAADVARATSHVSTGSPVNGIVEVAGPERSRLDVFIRRALRVWNDPREVLTDPDALFFGARLGADKLDALVPRGEAIIGEVRFDDWLGESADARREAA
jgi:uncharacterized protein YbjT (DUF2867 family)